MGIRKAVKNWLKEQEYDGLVNTDIECGCGINDLSPCCSDFGECEPAYKHKDGLFYKNKRDKIER